MLFWCVRCEYCPQNIPYNANSTWNCEHANYTSNSAIQSPIWDKSCLDPNPNFTYIYQTDHPSTEDHVRKSVELFASKRSKPEQMAMQHKRDTVSRLNVWNHNIKDIPNIQKTLGQPSLSQISPASGRPITVPNWAPPYDRVISLLLSSGGAHSAHIAVIAGKVTP